ncbi:ATP-binding protein [Streptomyces termitum]|uniref:Histidine kinase/HSP90-like ATPase domain-containing protein n=1 Tax=Streptomyces termitum TaxID=67368 RepID=A0A918W7Q0_9ACTN|nr:ATP-binding protein [Streptomyces termitum]GHA78288.1 hypothetical protein GCM10010305_22000 [Streptomyces termitum]
MTDVITAERAVPDPPPTAAVVCGGADGGAIASARAFTAGFLHDAADGCREPVAEDRVELAQLVVSELVTNALRHTGGPCRLLLELGPHALEISVFDRGTAVPVARGHDPRRIGQHGVEIVVAVCGSLTVEPAPGGKRVRARLPLRDDGPRTPGSTRPRPPGRPTPTDG